MVASRDSDTFTVERLNASTFTYKVALECAWLQLYGYRNRPVGHYIYGPTFAYKALEDLKYDFQNPYARIDAMKRQARYQEVALHQIARFYSLEMYTPGTDIYLLRDQDGRSVGMSFWGHYYKDMSDAVDVQVGRTGVWISVKRWYYSTYKTIADWFDKIRYGDLVMLNSRHLKFVAGGIENHGNKAKPVEALAKLNEQELTREFYPFSHLICCKMFQILPEYQRRGLGQKLMQESMSYFPDIKPVFGTTSGPQKIDLWASDEGLGMYKKCGFEPHGRFVHEDLGFKLPTTHMVLVR